MLINAAIRDYKIYLASQSPRRKMLLEGLDLNFEVYVKPGIDESYPEGMGMMEIPEYLAESKSENYLDLLSPKTLLITADTIVWHKGKLVGKPKDRTDAVNILNQLSGDNHEVVTGVCLRSDKKKHIFSSYSKVFFHTLSSMEIEYYVDIYKPYDKAGAYGIQEWIGYIGIEKIEGSFYNVMGLPVQSLYHELINFIKNE
jgi:septum formation protein